MGFLDFLLNDDLITIDQKRYDQGKNLTKGARFVVDLADDVLDTMSPTDDTPFVMKREEALTVALERLGAKLGK